MTRYDRLRDLVDGILDGGRLNPVLADVAGPWSGVQGLCRVRGGELTATRTSRGGATVHCLTFTDGTGDKSTVATDSRTGDFGPNIGHDAWGDDGEGFLDWAEALR